MPIISKIRHKTVFLKKYFYIKHYLNLNYHHFSFHHLFHTLNLSIGLLTSTGCRNCSLHRTRGNHEARNLWVHALGLCLHTWAAVCVGLHFTFYFFITDNSPTIHLLLRLIFKASPFPSPKIDTFCLIIFSFSLFYHLRFHAFNQGFLKFGIIDIWD